MRASDMLARFTDTLPTSEHLLYYHAATCSARDRQPAALLKEKKNGPFQDPSFHRKEETKQPSTGPQFLPPANHYAECSTRYPAGAPSLEQFLPACYEIVRGCRCEYRQPTHVTSKCGPLQRKQKKNSING
jgi:hypothetical protein